MLRIGLLCISWSATSVGMSVLNKALVDYLRAPALISACQMGITVLVVGAQSWRDLAAAPRQQLLRWMIVPIFFAGVLLSASYAYAEISLTLLTLVRSLNPLVMLPVESLVMKPENRPGVSWSVVLGIVVMLVGAMLYSGGNLASISILGLGFALLNMLVAVSDRLVQRHLLTTECKDLTTGTCALINNLFGLVLTLLLATATGQFQRAAAAEQAARWRDPSVLVLLLLSGFVGTGIGVLGIECQRAISATSFSVMQNLSKVFTVSAGVIFFSDPLGSPLAVMGLCLSLGGSFVYGWAQQIASQAKKAAQASALEEACAAKITSATKTYGSFGSR